MQAVQEAGRMDRKKQTSSNYRGGGAGGMYVHMTPIQEDVRFLHLSRCSIITVRKHGIGLENYGMLNLKELIIISL
jgi:hypothetical protein